MRSVLCVLAVVTAIGSTRSNADSVSGDAQLGFELCSDYFAKPKNGRQALEANGWAFQGSENEYQWLSKNFAQSVVALGRNSGRDPQGCYASFHGMTVEEAMSLADLQAKRLKLRRTDLADAPFGVVWIGTVAGKAATMNVLKPIRYSRHRGAAIVLLAE